MAKDFLNKVYDKYEHRDYALTDDNLNPKREIRAAGSVEQEEGIDKTIAEVAKKLAKIKEAYRTALFADDDDPEVEADTSPSELVTKSKTLNDFKNNLLAGGGTDGSLFRVSDDSSFDEAPVIDALIDEIDRMVLLVMGRAPVSGKTADVSGENKTDSPDESRSSSRTGYDLTFGDRFNCAGYEGASGDMSGSGSESGAPEDLGLGGVSTTGDGDSSFDDSSDTNGDGEVPEQAVIDSLWDEAAGLSDSQDAQESAAAECAINQLGVLKAILVILKIIKIYQKIMMVIGAIMQIINIVQLAAGGWLNPTNFAKIAQLVAETVMALIAEIIAKLLQLLWDLLNEECSVKQAMSVWKSIIKNMNAAGQVFDETGKAITLTQSNIIAAAKAKNHIEELAKQMEEKYSLENVKKEAGEWAAAEWKDITSIDDGFATGVKNGWKDATKGAYGRYVPADLQQMIKQTIDAKNAMSAKYEKLAGTKVKTPAVEKALASLKGLKEE